MQGVVCNDEERMCQLESAVHGATWLELKEVVTSHSIIANVPGNGAVSRTTTPFPRIDTEAVRLPEVVLFAVRGREAIPRDRGCKAIRNTRLDTMLLTF